MRSTNDYDNWWNNEGSGYRKVDNEDTEEFVNRLTKIAWSNGVYVENTRVEKEFDNLLLACKYTEDASLIRRLISQSKKILIGVNDGTN